MRREGELRFPCPVCGRVVSPGADLPPWATVGGVGFSAEWLEQGSRRARAVAPAPGCLGLLDVTYPFMGGVGVPFWMLHMPPPAAYDGLIEHPECLAGLSLIRSRVTRILDRRDGAATAEAEVLDVLTLEDLLALPPTAGDVPLLIRFRDLTCAAGPYRYVESTIEGDVGTWAVGSHDGAGDHLLLWGEWGCDRDIVLGGNLLLDPADRSPFGGA